MEIKDYQKAGLKTDAENYEPIGERIFDNYAELKSVLKQFVSVSKKLDLMKKKLIYGKKDIKIEMKYLHETDVEERARASTLGPEVHGIIGVATESSELVEALLKSIETGDDLDKVNLMEEVGDIMWYQNLILTQAGYSFEHAADRNIAKLAKRYPDKFTEDAALNRDVVAERAILENKE